MIELVVTFRSSEIEPFNQTYTGPSTYHYSKSTGSATRVSPTDESTYHTVNSPTTQRPTQLKKAVYPCADYRVENGVLVIQESTGSVGGFIIPLGVIQEIKVSRASMSAKKLDSLVNNGTTS